MKRIFIDYKTKWWENLDAEVKKKKFGSKGRFLEETLKEELFEMNSYRESDRRLFFFSTNKRSSIDGRYKDLGVEEKYNSLDLKEHLIDGSIHRGVIWVLGNPHGLEQPVESVSLYVVKNNSAPITQDDCDLYFPILFSLEKLNIHLVFVNGETGDYWKIDLNNLEIPIPIWLSLKHSPTVWDKKIDVITEKNREALAAIEQYKTEKYPVQNKQLQGFGKKGDYKEIIVNSSIKAAIIDYGNQWRLIELGLLLRSAGYDAVRVIYNKEKHKNKPDRAKEIEPAGKGVEQKIVEEMLIKFAIDIKWK